MLTLLVAIACSWLAVTIQNQRKQTAAAMKIMHAGGLINVEHTLLEKVLADYSLARVTVVDLTGKSIADDALVHLEKLSQLKELYLTNTNITDAGLVHLQALRQLERLQLDHTQITDAGLVHLQGLHQLQYLNLSRTKVTLEGVYKVKQASPNCLIEY